MIDLRIARAGLFALVLLGIGACGDAPPEGVPDALREERRTAARTACIARELHQRAESNLETLASLPTGAAREATLRFQEGYARYAELVAFAAALRDSAASHSRTPADSARYIERATALRLRTPEPETLEANVRDAYRRDVDRLASDPDHPCNWE